MGLKLGLLNWEMTCFWFFAWSYSSTKAWNYLENCCFLLLGMLFWEFLRSGYIFVYNCNYIIICFKFFIKRTPTIFENWSVINFCFKVISVFNSWSNEKSFSYLFCGSNVTFICFIENVFLFFLSSHFVLC